MSNSLFFIYIFFLVSKATEHRTNLLNPVNDRRFRAGRTGQRYRFLDSVFFFWIFVLNFFNVCQTFRAIYRFLRKFRSVGFTLIPASQYISNGMFIIN